MAFADEPARKVEIKEFGASIFTDVSDYVLRDSTLSLTTGTKISGGVMIFDRSILTVIPDLTSTDEMKITVGDSTPDTLIFDGLLRDGGDNDATEDLKFQFKSYAILASDRQATEVFRDDAGTGDPVEVFKDLIDKYLPELNYDGSSIPAKDASFENFTNYRLQNENLKEAFDFIADYLNRIWYVDENKKIFLVVQSFTDSGYTLTTGDNIIGNLNVATDLKRWANYVAVDGKVFPVGFKNTFNGDASTVVFNIDIIPRDLTVTVDGTVKDGAIAGSDFAEDAHYIIDPDGKTITFTVAETPGVGVDNVVAEGTFHSKIHDEFQDSGSISRYKIKNKKLTNDNIEDLTQAKQIGDNYLKLFSVPIKIYSGKTFWNANMLPLNKVRVIDSERAIDTKLNVIEANFLFGESSFEIRFKLNSFDFTVVDLYEELVNRVKRLEFNQRNSGGQIAKYLFFGADFVISLNNLWIGSEAIGNSFTLDHPDTELDDATVYLDGIDGGGSIGTLTVERVKNLDDIWIEEFFTDWFKDAATTADWDTASKQIDFTNGEIARTKIVLKDNVSYSKATLTVTGTDLGNLTFKLSADGGSNKETVTNNTQHTFTDTDTNGIMCEIEASGNATITKLELRGET